MYSTSKAVLALAVAVFAAPAVAGVAQGANGVVASRSPLASDVGIEVMKAGGNAVDAAVAVGFALAVTYPSAGNLGGGGFMVVRLANGDIVANDHRETAPAQASRDMYLDQKGELVAGLSTASHLAVGVPGTVAGLLDALAAYGTLPREAVLAPAVKLAKDGFPLPADLAAQFERLRERFAQYPASLRQFTKPGDKPYQVGDTFRQADLAATLERIAKNGRASFYGGRNADLIVAEMHRSNGLITHQDLMTYRSVWRAPIRATYRGYEILSMPPPSSGGALLAQMLNMLEPFDIGAMGYGEPATVHLMVEAERRAYADRAEHLGDPDFYDVPLAMLTAKDYARERFSDFDPDLATRSELIGAGTLWPEESPETTHVSVIDRAGNAVAYTTTLNHGYGSKIVVDGAGFLLNNEMDDFSAKENTANTYGLIGREANAIGPRKRMLSSMTPTIVLKDGEVVFVTGSPGGSTIITTVLQVVVNVIDHGMDLDEAVAAPRFHHQWLPDRVVFEQGALSPETQSTLAGLGHVNLAEIAFRIGDANSAVRIGDTLIGVADPRNPGGAAGF
ncbi:MAG: gamma-glutamyltransferase [Gammaproteobacteria bacterium]|nr:gamma-glutamyltransferase [Gammaproteobacteria bacterium]